MIRAVIALLLLSTSAQAANMHCVLKTAKGSEISYEFESMPNDYMAEVSITRGDTTISKARGQRPPWKITNTEEYMTLTPIRDPGYRIIMEQKLTTLKSVLRSNAMLFKGSDPLAVGGCGWLRSDLPEKKSKPEWGL